jgi:hypothetical protein
MSIKKSNYQIHLEGRLAEIESCGQALAEALNDRGETVDEEARDKAEDQLTEAREGLAWFQKREIFSITISNINTERGTCHVEASTREWPYDTIIEAEVGPSLFYEEYDLAQEAVKQVYEQIDDAAENA